MTAPYLIALDQGTTSSRAIVFDAAGNALASGQHAFPQYYPQPGWVEQDAMELLASEYRAIADALAAAAIQPAQIAALGVANQRETVVLWERGSGRPVAPAIVWQCRRTTGICEQLQADGCAEQIRAKTGLLIDAYFSGSKLRWLLDHVPGARRRAQRGELLAGTVESWLIWNLTAGQAHVSDVANASRTMLFDIDRLCWDDDLCRLLGIPAGILPQIVPSAACYGKVAAGIPGLETLAGTPIAAASGDQQAALFGQGCLMPGSAKNTYGTGCFMLANCGPASLRPAHGLLCSVGWQAGGETAYVVEGSVFHAGSAIQWLRDELGLIRSAPEINDLAASVADSNGVYFVPAFTGLGAPYWDMHARGMIMGLTRGANRAHLARAVLEAIAFQVADLLFAVEAETGAELLGLKADGGASASNLLLQFQADLLRRPVARPAQIESTARGAALLAGIGCGLYRSFADLPPAPGSETVFTPRMDAAEAAARYAAWQRAVAKCRA